VNRVAVEILSAFSIDLGRATHSKALSFSERGKAMYEDQFKVH
jgi:hypothetical protein